MRLPMVELLTVTLPEWDYSIPHSKKTLHIPVLLYVGKSMLLKVMVKTIPSLAIMLNMQVRHLHG